MEKEKYTISQLGTKRIPVCGRPRTVKSLQRMILDSGIPSQGTSNHGAEYYYMEDIEKAFHMTSHPRSHSLTNGELDEELIDIKKEISKETLSKLRNTNKIAVKELEKRDLEIQRLKSQSVDYQEAFKYLIARKTIMTAVVRRILITDCPMTICGMEINEARQVCEQLYNEYIQSELDTVNLWKRKYSVENDREFEREIETEIRTIINGKIKTNTEEAK